VLPAALGALLGLLLTTIVPRRRGQVLGIVALALLGLASYVFVSILNVHRSGPGEGLDASVRVVLQQLNFTRHPLTPHFWATEGLLAISERTLAWRSTTAVFLCALTSSALFALALGWFLSGTLYELAYSRASSASALRRFEGRSLLERLLNPLLRRYPETMILLVKDVKTFIRDPAQWSQVLIFFGILTLYIGNLRNFSYPLEHPFYRNLISFLNLGATCMTLATMTSRFVFPLVSLEGTRFWVLGLAPIRRRHIVMAKFYYSLCGALLLTVTLVLLSNYILRDSSGVLWIQLATAVLLSLGLSGLSVGMGAIFPSFGERNPSKIVSGFGGTLTLILAIMLVVFSTLGEALVCHRYLVLRAAEGPLENEPHARALLVGVMSVVAFLNILAAYIPMREGIRALEKAEF
jgi:ABC-2 type transport system permease protein